MLVAQEREITQLGLTIPFLLPKLISMTLKKQLILSVILTTYYLLLTTSPIFAVEICDYFPPCEIVKTPADLVNLLVPVAMTAAGIIFFILLIVSGFQIIMHAGSGDAKEINKWRQTLTAAIIGLGIIISAYWIVQAVKKVTGISIPGF